MHWNYEHNDIHWNYCSRIVHHDEPEKKQREGEWDLLDIEVTVEFENEPDNEDEEDDEVGFSGILFGWWEERQWILETVTGMKKSDEEERGRRRHCWVTN